VRSLLSDVSELVTEQRARRHPVRKLVGVEVDDLAFGDGEGRVGARSSGAGDSSAELRSLQ
jgi:hypothetical protein